MFYYQKAVEYESSKFWVRIILALGTNRKHTLLVRLRRLRLPRRPQPGNGKHILEHRPRFLSLLRILRIGIVHTFAFSFVLQTYSTGHVRVVSVASCVLVYVTVFVVYTEVPQFYADLDLELKKCPYCRTSNFKFFFENTTLNNNYSPK